MVLLAGPMYVCATASIPIAITLMMKGFSPGVAFVFLASGPSTNFASLAVMSKAMGKKFSALYVIIITILAILFGYLLDFIYNFANLNQHDYMTHNVHSHNNMLNLFDYILAAVFGALILASIYRKYFSKFFNKKELEMESKQIFDIEGMTCNHCVMNVRKAIEHVNGVQSVEVLLNENKAYVNGTFNNEEVLKAVSDVGYGIKF